MKVLVANRGEIACRVLKTLRQSGIPSVSVYTEPDAEAPHVWLADERQAIGEPRAYLDIQAILGAVKATGATAVHPGYGFLSENADFVRACEEAGVTFIGPSPEAMETFGDKRAARQVAEKAGVPVVPGAEACDTLEEARDVSAAIGFPVLVKAAGGGGGKGMRRVDAAEALEEAFHSAAREAQAAFNDPRLLVEKYVYPARHVEVQILGDGTNAVVVGDRECSLQRRYQKVIEEAPCAAISDEERAAIYDSARTLICAVGYLGAGTVEFLVGPDGAHYFLEVNTRLQVEHPITEFVTGMDLVAAQISLAHGGALPEVPPQRGHAMEARLNAEDAYNGYLPQSGDILMLEWPQLPFIRIDSGVAQGGSISPHYDSMIAKIISWGDTREEARTRLIAALEGLTLLGVTTNQSFLLDILKAPFFEEGDTFTTTVEAETWSAPEVPALAEFVRQRELQKPARRAAPAGGNVDAFSPWDGLGSFRMGE